MHLRSNQDALNIHLIAVYEQTRAVRELTREEAATVPSLLMEADQEHQMVLKPRVRELCHTIDNFICVVDASACIDAFGQPNKNVLRGYAEEIRMLLNPQWTRCVTLS